MDASVLGRGQACLVLHDAAEVALIGVSGFEGDPGQGAVRLRQEAKGLLKSDQPQVRTGRDGIMALECPNELHGGDPHARCQIADADRSAKFGVEGRLGVLEPLGGHRRRASIGLSSCGCQEDLEGQALEGQLGVGLGHDPAMLGNTFPLDVAVWGNVKHSLQALNGLWKDEYAGQSQIQRRSKQLGEQGASSEQLVSYSNRLVEAVGVFRLPGGAASSERSADTMSLESTPPVDIGTQAA